ncbi:MAG: sigma-70 family RNA polymerase sigma factor [Bacteroidia bacterium]|nr:sigma-70 family RNA polymerase sigma factor [Bacteroidia bacterium]
MRDKESKRVILPGHRDFADFFVTMSREEEIVDLQLEGERLRYLQRAIKELPGRYQEIIFHYFYENLSYEDIRLILGLRHVKSVRNLLYRAIRVLKTSFADGGAHPGQRSSQAYDFPNEQPDRGMPAIGESYAPEIVAGGGLIGKPVAGK